MATVIVVSGSTGVETTLSDIDQIVSGPDVVTLKPDKTALVVTA